MTPRLVQISVIAIAVLTISGCDACPPAADLTLGNGAVVNASANSGLPSQAGATWAFYAENTLSPLSILGNVVGGVAGEPGFLFRIEFGAQGEALRLFDNEVLAPETLGAIIELDALIRPAADPTLTYQAESYGAESDASVGLMTCDVLHFGPFAVADVRVEFSGATSSGLLGLSTRADGTLRVISDIDPLFAALAPTNAQSETVEIEAFALRED